MEVRLKGAGTKLDRVLARLPTFAVTQRRASSAGAARDLSRIHDPDSLAAAIRLANDRLNRGYTPPPDA